MKITELKLTPKRKKICEDLDFKTLNDALSYYPFRYDENILMSYSDFKENERVCFKGRLIKYPVVYRFGKRSSTKFEVLFEDNVIKVTVFNRPWLNGFELDKDIIVVGRYEGSNKVTAINYDLKEDSNLDGIKPVYSLKGDITNNEISKLENYLLDNYLDYVEDNIPSDLIKSHGLISLKEALLNIHRPTSKSKLLYAMSRLKYEEFLRFFLAININKSRNEETKQPKVIDETLINKFIDNLSFKLTSDQLNSVNEIINDLRSNKVMHRLLQGDVGSGKTVVSAISLYGNYLAGKQGALMAPTEILAKQHYETLTKLFKDYGVKVELLCSSTINQEEIKERLKNKEIDIIVGTHSLFQDSVIYNDLGLVIADEQHRFGVKQRKSLQQKGTNVDFLLMSATPIPRTLASSIYGDMSVSTIETMPDGRKGCETYLIKENSIRSFVTDIKERLKQGKQVYIICAAIEENENYKAKDATNIYASIQELFKGYKIGLMHSKLSNEDKQDTMDKFNRNEIQILVSTTVVEVGVNVVNATMMIIYDADRFGMSQIHQLRGRVQRGSDKGTCYLLTGSKDPLALERLEVLVHTNDGFEISRQDLRLRGPGDILGTRQSGLPTFIIGNLIEDVKFIEGAKKDALSIINNINNNIEYKKYYNYILSNYIDGYID